MGIFRRVAFSWPTGPFETAQGRLLRVSPIFKNPAHTAINFRTHPGERPLGRVSKGCAARGAPRISRLLKVNPISYNRTHPGERPLGRVSKGLVGTKGRAARGRRG